MATQPVTFRASEPVRQYIDGAAQMMGMNRTEFIIWALTDPARLEVKRRVMTRPAPPSPVENTSEPPAALGSD